jgi:UDP-2,4-diacetamido-2,4,6-trideoxy-beta-L-altropyranose hydrolase
MLRIRPVREEDRTMLWEWANEAGARASAFRSQPITWEEHVAWFDRRRDDPCTKMYVLLEDDEPVGQVRFEIQHDRTAEIDVGIARDSRRRGYGAEGLRRACARFFSEADASSVVAYIKPDNVASLRAFARAGFSDEGLALVHGQLAVRVRAVSPGAGAGSVQR